MKGYTKEDHMRAIAICLSETSTKEEKDEAVKISLAYQEQAAKDCRVCRFHFNHSSSEEGGHHHMCPHHPERYGDVAHRVRCLLCGVDTSLSNHGEGAVGATVWHSRGCYGSQLIDRLGESNPGELRIEICDVCLLRHHKRVIDSSSGKWQPWEPNFPEDCKGDRIQIFQKANGRWIGKNIHETGSESSCSGSTALEVLESLVKSETWMTKKGYPLGHKNQDKINDEKDD